MFLQSLRPSSVQLRVFLKIIASGAGTVRARMLTVLIEDLRLVRMPTSQPPLTPVLGLGSKVLFCAP